MLHLVNEDTNCAVVGDWKTNRGGLKFSSGYYHKEKNFHLQFQESQNLIQNMTTHFLI